jgi:hypothetical protein
LLKPDFDNSWAVVIGINEYTDPEISRLANAVNDAAGIATMLVTDLGFPKE